MSKKIAFILGVLFLICDSFYWLRIGGNLNVFLHSTVYLIPPFIAVIAGAFALDIYGLKGDKTQTLILLILGISCWFVGETFWYMYEFVSFINPFPSFADVFYLLSYPLFLLALMHEIKSIKISWKKIHPSIIFLFVFAFISLAILVVYFGVILAFDPTVSIFANVIAMGYGIGDLLLVVANTLVLVLAWEFRGGKMSRVWISLFIAFISILVADILFAIHSEAYEKEVWFWKSLLDSFWMLGYILFAFAFFDFGFSILAVKRKLANISSGRSL